MFKYLKTTILLGGYALPKENECNQKDQLDANGSFENYNDITSAIMDPDMEFKRLIGVVSERHTGHEGQYTQHGLYENDSDDNVM
ncbi:hypothetical protein OSTOST_19029 [Ostertagia ostertagi]